MVTTLELYIFTSSSIIKFIKSLRLYIPLLKRNRIEETFQRAIFTLTKILQKLFYFKLYIWRDPSYKKKKKEISTFTRNLVNRCKKKGWMDGAQCSSVRNPDGKNTIRSRGKLDQLVDCYCTSNSNEKKERERENWEDNDRKRGIAWPSLAKLLIGT